MAFYNVHVHKSSMSMKLASNSTFWQSNVYLRLIHTGAVTVVVNVIAVPVVNVLVTFPIHTSRLFRQSWHNQNGRDEGGTTVSL